MRGSRSAGLPASDSRNDKLERTRALIAAGALVVVALAASACSTSTSTAPKPPPIPKPTTETVAGVAAPSGSWPYPNADLANTRIAPGSVISSANVSKLQEAWTLELTGKAAAGVEDAGSFAANPVVVNGVVYIQDLDANVYAVDLATGKLDWEYPVGIPEASGPGPDGVAVANGAVYGDSSTAVFALSAATGKPIWVDSHLLTKGQGKFEIQPQVANGRVYIASAYGDGPGGGVLLALDAATGKLLWSFNTLRSPDPSVQAIGVGSGGAWETPLVGTDGSVTFGIGNPYQSLSTAVSHPDAQLYTDSEVNLDAATGALRWYYQAVPNDWYDHDMQDSPIATSIDGVPVIIGGGKMGYVYAMNATTGKLIWKTPVGVHDGHDNDSLLAMEHKFTLKVPYTYEPGGLGGVLTDMALANGTVYVATCDLLFKEAEAKLPIGFPDGPASGEIEALSLATGKVEWDTKVPALPLGAATVSNDLLFTTLYNGELIALDRDTGAIVYRLKLPTTTNAPIAIAGNAVIIPAGGPKTSTKGGGGHPQLVAYTVP
jgi:alcohol dehydrogenase (cytochrome c)